MVRLLKFWSIMRLFPYNAGDFVLNEGYIGGYYDHLKSKLFFFLQIWPKCLKFWFYVCQSVVFNSGQARQIFSARALAYFHA